jgi:hypothetical protein
LRLNARAPDGRELLTAALACAGTVLVVLLASRKLSPTLALMAPLALALVVILVMRPVLCVCLTVGLAILCENQSFGLLTFQAHFYDAFFKRLTALDALVLLSAVSVSLDMLRDRRPLRFPRELRFADLILVLGMVSGIAVGKSSGVGLKSLVLAENLLFYLLLLPLVVANLKVEPSRLRLLLGGAFALALVKALLGLAEVGAHKGISIEGSANLTYYEPTANWVVMLAVLGIVSAVLARLRPPLWMLLGVLPLIASLVLSYRRSFWIATVLGLLLVVLLALSPVGRRLLVPTALILAAGIWLLGVEPHDQRRRPLPARRAGQRAGRPGAKTGHGTGDPGSLGSEEAAPPGGTRRRPRVRPFRRAVVVDEARRPRPARLSPAAALGRAARMAGVAPRIGADRAGLRACLAMRPRRPARGRDDRDLHGRGTALHGRARRPDRPAGAARRRRHARRAIAGASAGRRRRARSARRARAHASSRVSASTE